jgi:hypothetical protein
VRNGNNLTPTLSDFQAWAAEFAGLFVNNFTPLMSGSVTVLQADCLYYGETGADLGSIAPSGATGSKSGGVLPASCAICVSWHVQQHYRGGHPRTYLTGLVQTDLQDATSFTSSYVTSVAAAANNFHAGVNAMHHGSFSDCHLGTVSFVNKKAWRTPPIFRDYVLAQATVDNRVDSQRRRLGPDR